jgi:hypothetical protein
VQGEVLEAIVLVELGELHGSEKINTPLYSLFNLPAGC